MGILATLTWSLRSTPVRFIIEQIQWPVLTTIADGPMSSYIFSLKKGDTLELKGPIPKYKYEPNKDGKIGMIAGGTGITPMLQVIQRIFANPEDKTKVREHSLIWKSRL
jgi:NAD(P)H-flavin reductase